MNSTLAKQNKDSMAGKQNISRTSLKVTIHQPAIADHVKTTGHDIKWDHFDILASEKTYSHCKIKGPLFIQTLKPSLNVNVSGEKLLLY